MTFMELIRAKYRRVLIHRRAWAGVNIFADAAGIPREYITCQFCGATDWRLPPHGLNEPCPIAEAVLDSVGHKIDAERMLAVRSGVHMEELRHIIEDLGLGRPDEEDPDEQ